LEEAWIEDGRGVAITADYPKPEDHRGDARVAQIFQKHEADDSRTSPFFPPVRGSFDKKMGK
jgi:hypothetical protein